MQQYSLSFNETFEKCEEILQWFKNILKYEFSTLHLPKSQFTKNQITFFFGMTRIIKRLSESKNYNEIETIFRLMAKISNYEEDNPSFKKHFKLHCKCGDLCIVSRFRQKRLSLTANVLILCYKRLEIKD